MNRDDNGLRLRKLSNSKEFRNFAIKMWLFDFDKDGRMASMNDTE